MAQVGFIAAMRHFLGFREGRELTDFAAELKELTPKDREELVAGLRLNGIDCAEPLPGGGVKI